MAALTANRNTAQWGDHATIELIPIPVKANTQIFAGSIVVWDTGGAAGYAAPGRTATGLICAGMAWTGADNRTATTGGAAGAITIDVRRGTFKFGNSAAGDLIGQANAGGVCYIVDDQTVALTDATGTRSIAGMIVGVDADGGVWVELGIRAVKLV